MLPARPDLRRIDAKRLAAHHRPVPRHLHREALAAYHAEFARQLGCEPGAFSEPGLTICQKPPDSREPHLALIVECGLGTVVSIADDRLIPWVREKAEALPYHFRVFQPEFLESFRTEAVRVGHEGARSHSTTTGMVLAELPAVPTLAEGLQIDELQPEEIARERQTEVFDNALLEPGERPELLVRFRTAFAAKDASGGLLAVSGVWDQYPGIDEIGVDVARSARGQGLARTLTLHAAHWIRSQGRWPIYTAGSANLRSINNGIACGFRPAWLITVVYVPYAGG